MKKGLFILLTAVILAGTGCGSIFGGKITECQKNRPAPGEPTRQIRMAAMLSDVFLTGGIGLIVDFSNGAIYKPCNKNQKK